MPNFITKILTADYFSNFKVAKLEYEFEPGDLDFYFYDSDTHKPNKCDICLYCGKIGHMANFIGNGWGTKCTTKGLPKIDPRRKKPM